MANTDLRPIKFRGYNKKRGEWLYGSYILNRGSHFIAPDEFAEDRTWEDYEVTLESIGQFTGLQDEEGVDIYEGDIVHRDDDDPVRTIFAVEYSTDFADTPTPGFVLSGGSEIELFDDNSLYYVIGNMFENNELLKKGTYDLQSL